MKAASDSPRDTAPSSMRSRSRPGEATSRCGPDSSRAACSCFEAPPKRVTVRSLKAVRNDRAALAVCCATSRVGASTRARGFPGGCGCSSPPEA